MEEEQAAYIPVRLDVYLQSRYPHIPRSQIQRYVKDGSVTVDGEVRSKNGYMVKEHADVTVDFNVSAVQVVEPIDIPVLYEDDQCVVIDKPLGILTHSKGVFNPESTVATWLAERPGYAFERDDDNLRAGIVHRLDRATSGVMICAKNNEALRHLQKQFHDRKAKKTYIARITGELDPPTALIDLPIERNPKLPQRFRVGQNGKSSQTQYTVLQSVGEHDHLVELKPLTGRTHQLRVHLEYMHRPIVGDTFYDGRPAERLFLHAHQLEITLPNSARQIFTADVPANFYKETL